MSAQEGAFPQDVRRAAGHARALFFRESVLQVWPKQFLRRRGRFSLPGVALKQLQVYFVIRTTKAARSAREDWECKRESNQCGEVSLP